MLLLMLVYELDSVVADSIGVVVRIGFVCGICMRRDLCVVTGEGIGIIEAACAVYGSVEAVVPALPRSVIFGAVRSSHFRDVPFAGHHRAIAPQLHRLGNRDAVSVQVSAVTG